MIIEENVRGKVQVGGNELLVDSVIDDPPKVRQGSPVTGGAFGCLSGDRINLETGHRAEKVLLIFKPDDSGGEGGCYDFFAQRPNTEDDPNMVRVARLTTSAFEVFVPLVLHAGGQPPTPSPTPIPAPAPSPQPAPVPPPVYDPTHGIPAGDFEGIVRYYGFPSDDQQPYLEGRLSWADVIRRMDSRAS